MANLEEVLEFWFGHSHTEDYGKPRQYWFVKNKNFDEEVRSRFLSIYQKAAAGELNNWQESPLSCLALIIILDQFPRHMFRDTPQAFATDNLALKYANYAVDRHYDKELLPVQRWFIYCAFEHSEKLEDQEKAVALFSTLESDRDSASAIAYARKHLKVIQQFGRFPHRNKILGRQNTPEEDEFLKQPGSSF
jgi:uncharacterized protein (DUF924 family)